MDMDESHHQELAKKLFSEVEAINTYCQLMLKHNCSILEILAKATKKLNKAHNSLGYPLSYWSDVESVYGIESLLPIFSEINKETIFTYSPNHEMSLSDWPPIVCCIDTINIIDLSVKLYDISNNMRSQNRYSITSIGEKEIQGVRLSQVDSLEYINNEKLALW